MIPDHLLENNFKKHLKQTQIEDRDELLLLISTAFPWTGIADALFCNEFMYESVELIKNSIMVFEQGFFDAGFYFLRQSVENMNNMLLVYSDKQKLKNWLKKEKFPTNKRVLNDLLAIVDNYGQIKQAIPEWFNSFDALTNKVNKYIHKQGFDTFYDRYKDYDKIFKKTNQTFNKYLKSCIAQIYIIYIALSPISLLLGDPVMSSRIHFDLMDEPVPIDFLSNVIGEDFLSNIKTTHFYVELAKYFNKFEPLNYETELLMKYQLINTKNSNLVREQYHLLQNPMDRMAFDITCIADISYVFFSIILIAPYRTDIEPTYEITSFSSDMFDGFVENGLKNREWNKMFLNSFINENGLFVVLLSNKQLTSEEYDEISNIVDKYFKDFSK